MNISKGKENKLLDEHAPVVFRGSKKYEQK
jgi:hypothetical protein